MSAKARRGERRRWLQSAKPLSINAASYAMWRGEVVSPTAEQIQASWDAAFAAADRERDRKPVLLVTPDEYAYIKGEVERMPGSMWALLFGGGK